MSINEPPPLAHQLPTPFWQRWLTTATTGAGIGLGVGFMKSGDSMDAFLDGALLTDAAIGTLASSGVGLLYHLGHWSCTKRTNTPIDGYGQIAEGSLNPYLQITKKAWYQPSTTTFYSWDVRVFLFAQAVAVLAASIAADQRPVVGELLGRGVGSMIGTIIGLLYNPTLLKRCITETKSPILKRQWHQESRHDIPVYTRLFFGAYTGYVATYAFYNPNTEDHFDHSRMLATIITSLLSLLSPLCFGVYQYCLPMLITHRQHLLNNPFPEIAWRRESQMDLPWYMRIFAGIISHNALGTAYTQTLSDLSSAWFIIAVTAAGLSPCCFTTYDWLKGAPKPSLAETQTLIGAIQPQRPLKIAADMPWYFRIAISSVAASTLTDSVSYLDQKAPSQRMTSIIMTTMVTLAFFSPCLMAAKQHCGYRDENPYDLTMPWYVRLFAGLWLGALIGTAFGTLIPSLGNKSDVFSDNIGPDFLGISNAVSAPQCALATGALSLIWQPITDKIASTCRKKTSNRQQQTGGAGVEINIAETSLGYDTSWSSPNQT
jgi:hypothetical protein